jgi:putative protease
MEDMIRGQLGKTTGIFSFMVTDICPDGDLPFMPASALNAMRREIAQELENIPCNKKDILYRTPEIGENSVIPAKDVTYKTNISNNLSLSVYKAAGSDSIGKAYELDPVADAELMRSRYCIRYELGICPVHHRVKDSGPLFLLNNGRRLALHFDCRNCEMTVTLP